MTDPDPSPLFADGCTIIVYGNAKPTDTHLASTIHRVDDEIIGWLKRRDDAGRDRSPQIEKVRLTPIHSALVCSCSIF
ncbi:MAG: hypothetical protein WCE52_19530 [Candidatus Acidiferrum sp.]